MGMNTNDLEMVLLHNGLHFCSVFVPNAKTCCRATNVGPVRPAGTETGVETNAEFLSWKILAKITKLIKRTRIEQHAGLMQVFEILWQLLSGQRNFFCGNAGFHRPFDLKTGAGIKVQPQTVKQTEDITVGQGFHGIAWGQAEGMRKV